MGIKGLLQALKPTPSNIQNFSNQTLAIDASSWLQKGCYPCGERLVEHVETYGTSDKDSNDVVAKYIMTRCSELLLNVKGIKLILVFDGLRCPLKKETNEARRDIRTKNLIHARTLKKQGKMKEAREKYMSCTKFTQDMALYVAQKVTEKYKNDKVKVVLSPYEADAQLAYLCKLRLADGVITEDSDVLVYSASCNVNFPILYKLDRKSGCCNVFSMSWIDNPALIGNGSINPSLLCMAQAERKSKGSGRRMFVQACVLTGNDYTNGIAGVGIIGAFKCIMEQSIRNAEERFSFVLVGSKIKHGFEEYETIFKKIEAIFYYHYVINDAKVIMLTDTSSDCVPNLDRFENTEFLGDPERISPLVTSSTPSKDNSIKRSRSDTKSSFFKKKQKTVVEKNITNNNDDTSNKEEEEFQRIVSSLQTKDDKIQTNKFASFINPNKDHWISKTKNVTPSPLATNKSASKDTQVDNEKDAKMDLFRDFFNDRSKIQSNDSDSGVGHFPYDADSPSLSPENNTTENDSMERFNPKSNVEIIDLSTDSSISLFYDNLSQDNRASLCQTTSENRNKFSFTEDTKEITTKESSSSSNYRRLQTKKTIKKKIVKKVAKKGQMLKTIQSFFKPVQK